MAAAFLLAVDLLTEFSLNSTGHSMRDMDMSLHISHKRNNNTH